MLWAVRKGSEMWLAFTCAVGDGGCGFRVQLLRRAKPTARCGAREPRSVRFEYTRGVGKSQKSGREIDVEKSMRRVRVVANLLVVWGTIEIITTTTPSNEFIRCDGDDRVVTTTTRSNEFIRCDGDDQVVATTKLSLRTG